MNFKQKIRKTRDWIDNKDVNSSVFCVVIPRLCVFNGGKIRLKSHIASFKNETVSTFSSIQRKHSH